jgi:hypothetical protein
MKKRVIVISLAIIALAVCCRPRKPVSAQPHGDELGAPGAKPVTKGPKLFESKEKGVSLSYPSDWTERENKDYELEIVPSAGDGSTAISLEVPKLPPHIPGMIPLGSVVNGYIDDLKKQHPGVKIEDNSPVLVDKAKAKRVRSSWDGAGEEAVLTVHGDRVYIFRANADAGHAREATQVLNQVLESVKW